MNVIEKVKKGVLKAVSAEVVSLEEEQTVKDGKKKKKIVLLHEIPFDQIKQSIIKVSF